jgi:thiol-disulfide isomerase/thioredoxin
LSEILIDSSDAFDALFEDDKPIIALFTAPAWCQPCRALEPQWKSLVETLDNYTIAKIDCGSSPEDTADHWATKRFGIRGVPQIYAWGGDRYDDYSVIKGRTVIQIMHELGY